MTGSLRLDVAVERLPHGLDLPLPTYATSGAAGLDLLAAIPEERPVDLMPRQRLAIPTGLRMALPVGYEAQVRPRSGLALRHGITVLNSPGTIDSDYRGEIKVILINLGEEPVRIARGERIAQLVVAPVVQLVWEEVSIDIEGTARGVGGFGSTGGHGRVGDASKG
jgi:dUTP pyrophosphatase